MISARGSRKPPRHSAKRLLAVSPRICRGLFDALLVELSAMATGDNIHVGETTPSGDECGPPPDLPKSQAEFFARACEKVRSKFPTGPGIYLFQDKAGR